MSSEPLGTSRVTTGWKIALIKEVREELDGGDIGDFIAYRKEDGKIVLEILE